ncbi:UrcA family protein [Parvularcula dongshanensis]|uniref:UrcA family protein n=1 Tax=Parvularcula dongshanensis TaxID=1173995 RepID=A0A840I304_9PROT|nr:UrcA family protein [Parvularcula dongshanensis]MBB4659386.1 UrcA family protein [Parvularcula dongshanensis]
MTFKTLLVGAAALTTLIPFATASAGGREVAGDDFTYAISVGALTSSAAAKAEYVKLERAVKRYCDRSGERGLTALKAMKSCRAEVMAAAVQKMPADLLALADADAKPVRPTL